MNDLKYFSENVYIDTDGNLFRVDIEPIEVRTNANGNIFTIRGGSLNLIDFGIIDGRACFINTMGMSTDEILENPEFQPLFENALSIVKDRNGQSTKAYTEEEAFNNPKDKTYKPQIKSPTELVEKMDELVDMISGDGESLLKGFGKVARDVETGVEAFENLKGSLKETLGEDMFKGFGKPNLDMSKDQSPYDDNNNNNEE